MLLHGDSLQVLKDINNDSIDLIVTDPPYGIEFMGKDWDKALPSIDIWKECFRVLKTGKLAFVMCSPRQDVLSRMIISLEDSGFRTNYTSIYWTYASGFPKAANVSKLIDKRNGAVREIIGYQKNVYPDSGNWGTDNSNNSGGIDAGIFGKGSNGKHGQTKITKPATEEAKKMEGAYVGFQPKPAVEVILVVSKGKTLTWLDDVRIPYNDENDIFHNHKASGWNQYAMTDITTETIMVRANPAPDPEEFAAYLKERRHNKGLSMKQIDDMLGTNTAYSWWEGRAAGIQIPSTPEYYLKLKQILDLDDRFDKQMTEFIEVERKGLQDIEKSPNEKGRFPANLLVSDDVLNDSTNHKSGKMRAGIKRSNLEGYTADMPEYALNETIGDSGSYSRYFDLDKWAEKTYPFLIVPKASASEKNKGVSNDVKVNHPTIKPLKLFSYLITMGSRENDLILDPFCGSGTTLIAADNLARKYIGIEINKDYLEIAKHRLLPHVQQTKLNFEYIVPAIEE